MRTIVVLCCLILGGVVSACGSSSSDSSTSTSTSSSSSKSSGKKYDIVFNTAFIGNDSQPQSNNVVKYVAANVSPYKEKVNFSVSLASAATVPAQLASLQAVIRDKPDGLIVFPFSETALNGVLTQACNAGIKVVAEDLTATAPCVYNRTYDVTGVGHDQASFMCKVLNGKGNVLVDRGQPGGSVAGEEIRARKEYLSKECPGVKIVGYYTGFYTPGKELVAVSNALAAHPNVDGVLSDYSCSGVLQAFKKAGRDPVPVACFAVNGNATACVNAKVNCLLYSSPTTEFAEAMDQLVGLLDGKQYPKNTAVKQPTYIVQDVDFDHDLPLETLKAGETYFPDKSAHLVLPVGTKQFPQITPEIALGQAK